MALQWTRAAFADLARIHEFLVPVSGIAAVRAVAMILARVERVPLQPRLGERLPGFGQRDVRRVIVGHYEVRYELNESEIVVLWVFLTREAR